MSERPTRYRTRDLLSPRQREVLALVAKGRTNAEIARELGIGFESVKSHVSEILLKLNVDSREDAAAIWRESQSAGGLVRRFMESLGVLATGKGVALGVAGLAGVVALSIAVVLSQSGSESPVVPPSQQVSSGPIAPPVAPSGPYPVGTRTGDPVIDNVLAAVEARDAGALFDLVEYSAIPCMTLAPPHGFKCPEGASDGTVFDVLPTTNTQIVKGDAEILEFIEWFLADTEGNAWDHRLHFVMTDGLAFTDDTAEMKAIVRYESGQTISIGTRGWLVASPTYGSIHADSYPAGTVFRLPPPAPPPGGRAGNVVETLFGGASHERMTEDPSTFYGAFDIWGSMAPTRSIDLGGGPASVTSISVAIRRGIPDETVAVAGTTRDYLAFAVVDAAGTCATAWIAHILAPPPFGAGWDFGTIPYNGGECSGNAVLELLGLP